jgi:protein-S-isoprenylcysteine O-methyltransferase Ste14
MPDNTFKIVFLILWIATEVIRAPHRRRNRRDRSEQKITDSRLDVLEVFFAFWGALGMMILPLVYVFTGIPTFADYDLPDWAGWLGTVIFAASIVILWRAHADLGTNWSPTLEIRQEHKLVTSGIYQYIRHPIYAAIWLSAIAQLLLLHNWIAGPSLFVTLIPIYLMRVPREEKMMLDNFGDEYRAYMNRTGGIIPRFGGNT